MNAQSVRLANILECAVWNIELAVNGHNTACWRLAEAWMRKAERMITEYGI